MGVVHVQMLSAAALCVCVPVDSVCAVCVQMLSAAALLMWVLCDVTMKSNLDMFALCDKYWYKECFFCLNWYA